ncbi:OFA family MFS transporter [Granulibacter bethesdensis]|uniref:OFA family MFS transporter n=1 Tax=Granulibacter bethesdensis TaxID=364410 RepID=UPI00090AE42A|nr:OFA family MFS transporter [Granulibacter bethesdensis]APH60275.1 Transporter, MFS superfamily [Granulibacter bethesdensis]
MSSTEITAPQADPGILDRARIIAQPGFNRWLVPPAALAIHLCIGMAYGLSVFWLPMQKIIGTACPASMGELAQLTTTDCDWSEGSLVTAFKLGIVFLGISAAIWGGWLERVGPHRAGVVAALCWSGGWLISALGIYQHQLWLIWLGLGVIGGIGLGIGYISPVSTLIKWFPDRRGMATGMAIMGFGGGAVVGSPLALMLLQHFRVVDPATHVITQHGLWQTFTVMGLIYLVFMLGGAFAYRIPPDGWRPDGFNGTAATKRMIAQGHVHLGRAWKTPQFWLLWAVLMLNVSAGIAVLSIASPMLQRIFGGALIDQPGVTLANLSLAQKTAVAGVAGGFVSLLSLFNIGGRFFWATISDKIGRKLTYTIFFILGAVLYTLTPVAAHAGHKALFVLAFCLILSMYGGGFATIPAYLADIFGTRFVGAIHGRLLTAWSTAGVVGPTLVTVLPAMFGSSDPVHLYDTTFHILAGLLILGLIANWLVRPLPAYAFMSEAELASLQVDGTKGSYATGSFGIGVGGFSAALILPWLIVGLPIAWGIWKTIIKAAPLFN